MAIKADKLGPGSLKFGETGSPIEFAASCTNVELSPELDKGDELIVLSGERTTDKDEKYTLKGKLLQSFERGSLIEWTHVNANQKVPFTFKPLNDGDLSFKGEVTIRRIPVGGDVDKKNESDFEFEGSGMYDLVGDDGTVITSYRVGA